MESKNYSNSLHPEKLEDTNIVFHFDQRKELTLQEDTAFMFNQTYSLELEQLMLHSVQTLDSIYQAIKSLNATAHHALNTSIQLNANVSTLTDSEPFSDPDSPISNIESILYGYTIPITAGIGLVLNILGIYFLTSANRSKQIHNLLLSNLLFFNAASLVLEFFKSIEHQTLWVSSLHRGTYRVIVNSGIRFSRISSILMLISLSRARLSTIQNPARYNGGVFPKNERRTTWLKYCAPVIIASCLLTLPILLEYKVEYEDNGNQKEQILVPSTLRLDKFYSILYIGVLNLFILGLLPITYLLYLANRINVVRLNKNIRFEYLEESIIGILDILLEATPERKNSIRETVVVRKQENEIKLSISMVRGILIFVAFHILRIVTTIGELYILLDPNKDDEELKKGYGVPIWLDITCVLSELCAVINSSIVPLIYICPHLTITMKG